MKRKVRSKKFKKIKSLPIGVIRLGKDLKFYEKTKSGWKKSKEKVDSALEVAKLFKAHKNFDFLIDSNDTKFLRGMFITKGGNRKVMGGRINVLPNGKKLDKAYSLFASDLIIHDEISNEHWDVLYRNPGGGLAYVYTLDKDEKARQNKYSKVEMFEKMFPKLKKRVENNLDSDMGFALYTLFVTKMRIGNEIYYKLHKHKGLSTLTKDNISINGKKVIFDFIGKDGVPQIFVYEFPNEYLKKLKSRLKKLKKNEYVFSLNNRLIKEEDFKKAFKTYCGKEFYPHIVRSYYATKQAEDFFKKNKKRKLDKKSVNEFYNSVADVLGHKKFSKKKNEWEDSFSVTIHHYINPRLVEKIESLVE